MLGCALLSSPLVPTLQHEYLATCTIPYGFLHVPACSHSIAILCVDVSVWVCERARMRCIVNVLVAQVNPATDTPTQNSTARYPSRHNSAARLAVEAREVVPDGASALGGAGEGSGLGGADESLDALRRMAAKSVEGAPAKELPPTGLGGEDLCGAAAAGGGATGVGEGRRSGRMAGVGLGQGDGDGLSVMMDGVWLEEVAGNYAKLVAAALPVALTHPAVTMRQGALGLVRVLLLDCWKGMAACVPCLVHVLAALCADGCSDVVDAALKLVADLARQGRCYSGVREC